MGCSSSSLERLYPGTEEEGVFGCYLSGETSVWASSWMSDTQEAPELWKGCYGLLEPPDGAIRPGGARHQESMTTIHDRHVIRRLYPYRIWINQNLCLEVLKQDLDSVPAGCWTGTAGATPSVP